MTSMIQCPHCQEDMNPADWEANEQFCISCGRPTENPVPRHRRRLIPLISLRKKLEAQVMLRKSHVYV